MDTNTFHDALVEAGLNLRDEDLHYEAYGVAVDVLLADKVFFVDNWIDFVSNTPLALLCKMSEAVEQTREDLESAGSRACDDNLRLGFSMSTTMAMAGMGAHIYRAYIDELEKYVERNIAEWVADVCSYAGDMEEGAREDWAYQNWKERQEEEK